VALGVTLIALLASVGFVFVRRFSAWSRANNPQDDEARAAMTRAWRLR